MGIVNVRIKHNSTYLDGYVLGYERVGELCSGIGTLKVVVDPETPRTFNPGDTMTLYEDGGQVGQYFIGDTENNPKDGLIISCQDGSKWLQDYFLAKKYKSQGLSTKYWIGFILDRAKLNYQFITDETGYNLNPYEEIGLEGAYELVTRLCQQSGWYFYFDSSNKCIIGTLNSSWSSYTLDIKSSDEKTITEYIQADDSMLRNNVIVYGNGFSLELRRRTAWDKDKKDKRTIVYSNGMLTESIAAELGLKILNTFAKTKRTKIFTIAGHVSADLGEIARCKTKVFNGSGRITKIASSAYAKTGFLTEITLDTRCPRIFGYWRYGDSDFVYVGTKEHGIWKKTIEGDTWYNDSTGITNLNIRDLKVKSGMFVTTTDTNEAYYRNIGDTSWTSITPESFVGTISGVQTEVSLEGAVTAGCGIYEDTGDIIVGYNLQNESSWILRYKEGEVIDATQVEVQPGKSLTILDTDTNNLDTLVTAVVDDSVTSAVELAWNSVSGKAESSTQQWKNGNTDEDTVSLGPASDDAVFATVGYANVEGAVYVENNIVYAPYGSGVYVTDLDTDTTEYTSCGIDVSDATVCYAEDSETVHAVDWPYHYVLDLSSGTYDQYTLPYVNLVTGDLKPYYAHGRYIYYADIINSGSITNQYPVLYQYDLVTRTSSTVTGSDINPSGHDIQGKEYIIVMTATHAVLHALIETRNYNGSSGYYCGLYQKLLYFSLAGGGGGQTSGQTELAYEWGGAFANTYISGIEYLSKNKDGNSYVAYAFSYKDNVNTTAEHMAFICNGQDGSVVREYSQSDPQASISLLSPWFPYRYAGGWSQAGAGHPIVGRTAALFYRNLSPTGAAEMYIYDAGTGDSYDASDYLTYEGSPLTKRYSAVVDEYDQSIWVGQGTNTKAYDYTTGNLVKTLSLPVGVDNQFLILPRHVVIRGTSYSIIRSFTEGGVFPTASGLSLSLLSDKLVTYSGGTFGIVDDLTPPGVDQTLFALSGVMSLECSQSSPTIAFGGYNDLGHLEQSFTVLSGSAEAPTMTANSLPLTTLHDARTLSMVGLIYDKNGTAFGANNDLSEYIFAVTSGDMVFRTTDSESLESEWNIFVTQSGMNKLESTNYSTIAGIPYIFYSISGSPSKFYQRSSAFPVRSGVFVEKSTSLPGSNITVIRVDDKI